MPDERILANRPHGVIDPPLQVISSIAFPIISGAYLGVAEAAYAEAVRAAAHRADDPIVQRTIGEMRHTLRVAAVGASAGIGGCRVAAFGRRPRSHARGRSGDVPVPAVALL